MFSEAHRSEVSNTLKQRQAEISHEADVKVAALRAEMETAHTQAEVVKQRALEEARREAEQGKQQLQRELAAAETKQRLNEVHARAQGPVRMASAPPACCPGLARGILHETIINYTALIGNSAAGRAGRVHAGLSVGVK